VNMASSRELPILVFTIIVFVAFSIFSRSFLTVSGMRLVFEQAAIVGIVAIAVTMTLIMGGIDLSVGSLMAMMAAAVGILMNHGVPSPLACLLTLAFGGICGLANGLLVTKANIPDIVTTLGTMYVFRSAGILISGGIWIKDFPASFNVYARGTLLGIPVPVIIWISLTAVFTYILKYTWFGRRIYAIGGNTNAAWLSGVSVGATKTAVYVLSGVFAAVSGIIFASKVGNVQVSTVALNLPFDVLAAILIGGTSVFGGIGSPIGTALGALALSAVQSGVIQIRLSPYWIDVSVGLFILLAVVLNTVRRVQVDRKLMRVLQ
jgi:ribose/xylose/arabinose/galactoside ABC-type transport system permease subunit